MTSAKQFFLRCDPDAKCFYEVRIFETRKQMIAEAAAIDPEHTVDASLEAACLRFRYVPQKKYRELARQHQLLGQIFFHRGNLQAGTIVHELTHAAIYWARRNKLNPLQHSKDYAACPEEKFVRCLQYLFEQCQAQLR